jgi:hypothetical protein
MATVEEQIAKILENQEDILEQLGELSDGVDEVKESIANLEKEGSGFSVFNVED